MEPMEKLVKCVVQPMNVQLSPLARISALSRRTPELSQSPVVVFQKISSNSTAPQHKHAAGKDVAVPGR